MDKKNKHRGNLNIKNSWRTAYENYFDETQVGSEQAHKRKKNALIALVSMLLLMLAGLFVGNAWARHGGYDGDDYNLGTVNIGQTYSSGTFRTDNAVAVEAKIKVNSVWRDGRNICVNFTSSTYSGRYDHDVNQYWAFFSGGSEACYGAYRFRDGGGEPALFDSQNKKRNRGCDAEHQKRNMQHKKTSKTSDIFVLYKLYRKNTI